MSHPRSVALPAFISMVIAGIDVGMNGLLLSEGAVNYMAKAMLINLAATSAYMFYGPGRSGTLVDVWWGLVFFFSLRALQGAYKLLRIYAQKKAARCQIDLEPAPPPPTRDGSVDDTKFA
jgi:hypothetical protein